MVLMGRSKKALEPSSRRVTSAAEKRRLVDLTRVPGAVVRSVARDQGVRCASLYRWRRQFGAADSSAEVTRFLPIGISTQRSPNHEMLIGAARIEIVFACGTLLRIASDHLDPSVVGALVAELRR
jgi:transposase-like protein